MKRIDLLLLFMLFIPVLGWGQASISDLQKAAQNGDAVSQFNLGQCYAEGKGVPQSYSEALKWYHMAQSNGYADAASKIQTLEKEMKVMNDLKKAAQSGEAVAQYKLGMRYESGDGVPQSYSEAVKWYCQAANQDLVEAQCKLGYCYYFGKGVSQSYTEAVTWFRKAANQGNVDALNMIDECEKQFKQDEEEKNTLVAESSDNSVTPSYSKQRHRSFNTPRWNTRPSGFSMGYVQKQWVYAPRPEYADQYSTAKATLGAFGDEGESTVVNGIQLGIRCEPQFGHGFGLNTGIFYEFYYDRSNDYVDDEYNSRYYCVWQEHSINVPMHLEFRANFCKAFQVFVYGGVSADIGISSTFNYYEYDSSWEYESIDAYDDEYEMNRINASWEVGAGVRFGGVQIQWQKSQGVIDMAMSGAEYAVMQNKPATISLSFMF